MSELRKLGAGSWWHNDLLRKDVDDRLDFSIGDFAAGVYDGDFHLVKANGGTVAAPVPKPKRRRAKAPAS